MESKIPSFGIPVMNLPDLAKRLEASSIADLAATPLYALDPFDTGFDEIETARYYSADLVNSQSAPGDSISVMTWNLKYGGGRIDFWYDGHGDRAVMQRAEVIDHLEGIAEKLRITDPDLLLVQEIDVDSKRSGYVDQVQWLLDHTRLQFGAYASQWRSKLIPIQGLGGVDSGNAILSKYPVDDAQRLALPLMSAQDPITRYFYLKRALLTARVRIPGFGPVCVVDVHTEAFSKDGTKKRQIELFKQELDRLDAAGAVVVGGGDLNTLPPETITRSGFEDVVPVDEEFPAGDFRDEVGWTAPLYRDYQPAIPLEDYRSDNQSHCTHSTTEKVFWCRKLDYLFTNGTFVEGSGMTHQDASTGAVETMGLSDHAPVSATLRLRR